ncbi:MAG: YqaA family protein [Thermodesulfobacteriota bacterium]
MKILKRLYEWVLSWAHKPHGAVALFILAFAESSFFPIPPDILLIALCLSLARRSLYFALICSVGSVLGGVFGYAIGLYFMKFIGYNIIGFYGLTDKFDYIQTLYRNYDAWAVGIAGFTPIPYKVFTITAGAFKINFIVFVLASFVSRAARFFIVALLIRRYGEPIKEFIDRYFNILTLLFAALLIGGFILIKFVI